MSAVLTLAEPVAVEAIAAPLDRFHCAVYDAKLTARSCLDRQRAAREAGPRSHYGKCFDCAIGKRVAEQLNAPQAADVVTPCAYDGCRKGATEGKWCTFHHRIAPNKGLAPVKRRPLAEDPELAAAADAGERAEPAPQPAKPLPPAVRSAIAESAARVRAAIESKQVEEVSMAKMCAKAGCKREADPGRGDGTLCMPHHRGVLNAQIQGGKPKRVKPAPPRPSSAPAPRTLPKIARTQRAIRSATIAHEVSTLDVMKRAIEAVELVDAIGWDLARQLAARVKQATA